MAKNSIRKSEYPFVEKPSKSLLTILQTERTVIGYGITEDELEHVGSLNTQATTFFAVSAGLFTFAIGLVGDWLMEGQPQNYGELLAKVGAPICAVLAVVFLFLAIKVVRSRGSIIRRIKAQSSIINQ